jgi:hypothetical protein
MLLGGWVAIFHLVSRLSCTVSGLSGGVDLESVKRARLFETCEGYLNDVSCCLARARDCLSMVSGCLVRAGRCIFGLLGGGMTIRNER